MMNSQALISMTLLALQFGMQPMLTKNYTTSNMNKSTYNLIQELFKFILAFLMLLASGQFRTAIKDWTLYSWMNVATLPAGLYCVQNMASLIAYQHLDSITYNVLNQTKTLSAAFCCYLLMGRRQSSVQIMALCLLLLSALIIEEVVSIDSFYMIMNIMTANTSTNTSTSTDDIVHDYETINGTETEVTNNLSTHVTLGVIPVLTASFISGLTGAISQKNLQSNNTTSSSSPSSGGRNPFLFSMELCIASILFLLLSFTFSNDGQQIQTNGFFHGWTYQTMIPITTNSIGGILVGLVTKYAGSVRKGFALIFGLLLTGLVQQILDHKPVTREQLVGGTLAALSLWMHMMNPVVSGVTATATATGKSNTTSSTSTAHRKQPQSVNQPNVVVQPRRKRKIRKED